MTSHVAATAVRAGIAGLLVVASAAIAAAQAAGPTFTVRPPSDIGEPNPRDAVAADLNGDGHMDLVVTTSFQQAPPATHKVNFLTNNGNGVFTRQALSLGLAGGVSVADFNGDDELDLAVTTGGGAAACGFIPGVAIYFGPAMVGGPCLTGVGSPTTVQAGDFDRDGALDLAVASSTGSSMRIYRGSGVGAFGPGAIVNSSNLNVQDMARPVDVNGDGFLDIVVGASNTYRAFLGRGDGTFNAGAATVTGDNTLSVAVEDLSGDGIADLATIEAVPAGGQMRVRRGIGNGAFQIGTVYPLGVGGAADLALADLDDDGDIDIAVAGGSVMKARLFLNDGTATFNHTSIPSLGGGDPYRAIAADWNGDGLDDVAMIGPRAIQTAQVFVALQNDGSAPTVNITAPADGSNVSGNVSIAASAADNIGVTRVDFSANGAPIGSSTGPDFTIDWDASSVAGAYTITARAFDAAGNSADDSVSVNVSDIAAPAAPGGFTASVAGKFDADFAWTAATDNVGVHHYRLYELDRKSGIWEVVADNIIGTSAGLEGIKPRGQLHTFAVSAVDAAGNESARSAAIALSLKP